MSTARIETAAFHLDELRHAGIERASAKRAGWLGGGAVAPAALRAIQAAFGQGDDDSPEARAAQIAHECRIAVTAARSGSYEGPQARAAKRTRLLQAISKEQASAAKPAAKRAGPAKPAARSTDVAFRIVITPAGVGCSGNVGRPLAEILAPNAFGSAASVNARGFDLRVQHEGRSFAFSKAQARAVDAGLGIVIVAEIRRGDPARSRIEKAFSGRRCLAASVGMKVIRRKPTAISSVPAEIVTEAALDHIAVLPPGERPAHRGAVALKVGGHVPLADAITAAVAESLRRDTLR